MGNWTSEELDKINAKEMFELWAALPDGSTPKKVAIWSVRVDDTIYVRSYTGLEGKWYAPALESRKGRISAGGVTKDVSFVPIEDEATNKAVDHAFLTKYATSPYAEPMASEPVRSRTLAVIPLGPK